MNAGALKKGVELGQKTVQKIAVKVGNIYTHLANCFDPSQCDTRHLLAQARYDLNRLVRTRKDLLTEQRQMFEKVKVATEAVLSNKAVQETEVGNVAQMLTSVLKGFDAHLLNYEHIEQELSTALELFDKTYFEARYGDYIFGPTSRLNLEQCWFKCSSTISFTDPTQLVKATNFDELSKRIIEDMACVETDFDRLPASMRDDFECCQAILKSILAFKVRYFQILNRTQGFYQLAEYASGLLEEQRLLSEEMATEAVDEGSPINPVLDVSGLQTFDRSQSHLTDNSEMSQSTLSNICLE